MHSMTYVLLRPPFGDVRAAAEALLRPHLVEDDDNNYNPKWHLDYWIHGDGDIKDAETAAALGLTDDDYLGENVCFVSRLGGRDLPTCIVTPDGQWHDWFDFGWKLRNPESENEKALELWHARIAEIYAAHDDCLAVQYDTHS